MRTNKGEYLASVFHRILHQQPGLCLGAVTEHKLLFKELAHFGTRVKSFGILVQNSLF